MTRSGAHRIGSPSTDSTAAAWRGLKVLDLSLESRSIASARDPERTARTLARLGTLRLTLMRLKPGAKVQQHHADHELSIQTVSGGIVIHTAHERFEVKPGQIAILERGLVHDIEAQEESAILLTIGMSHRITPREIEEDAPLAED
jgi:quercetin dioxygenase-like cupin family protein